MPSIVFELGRSIVANAEFCFVKLFKRISRKKWQKVAVVDAAMNDLMRPSFTMLIMM